jgi:bifunctional non-homologous end joining protein LigD
MTRRAVELEGHRIALTNLDKVLWPEAGKTKAWMIEYYAKIAPVLLPHVRDRPLTIRRFPEGVDGPSWHQNEARGEPDWFPVFETSGRGGRRLRFCLVEDVASLVWLANNGVVELHPFQWRTDAPRRPVALVFDLDPGPPAGLSECAGVALLLRDVLEDLGLVSFAKTSGSVGVHVHVPLGEPHQGDDVKAFAKRVAEALAQERPDDVVAEMAKSLRTGKVFVDWLQNDPTRQTVAPYSLRGLPWPTVATPVRWDEIEHAAAGEPEALVFPAEDVLERVDRLGDLWAETDAIERALPRVRARPV